MQKTTIRKYCRLGMGLAAALLALQAAGQQAAAPNVVAQLKQLTGNVLVSRDTGMTAGSELLRITTGTRIITTANSEVVVVFDNGCEVRMKENQRLDVESDKPCAALVPANLAVAAPAAGPGVVGLIVPALLGASGAAAAVVTGPGPTQFSVSPN